eukprot:CAMPEP_0172910266 /NCGR_PEP_ID=MMETSP1075-20121228/184305_1 /TAXON_ID=2916 /ORGANISM="Ceratium fusus, Strain PA161109" /LENGTH=512 /DNA_ID=CAMNT_0013768371 /DNA_START=46 /DNA_END=1584 /DNA_ORIENTATION=+
MTSTRGFTGVANVRTHPWRNAQRPLLRLFVLAVSIVVSTGIHLFFAFPLVAPRFTHRGCPWAHQSSRPTYAVQMKAFETETDSNIKLRRDDDSSEGKDDDDIEYDEPPMTHSRAEGGFDTSMLTSFVKDRLREDDTTADEDSLRGDSIADEDQLQSGQFAKEDSWASSTDSFGGEDEAYANGDVLEARLDSAWTCRKTLGLMLGAPDKILAPRHIAAVCRRLALKGRTFQKDDEWDFNDFLLKAKEFLGKNPPDAQVVASLLWSMSPAPMQKKFPELQDFLVPMRLAMPNVARGMVLRNLTSSITALAKLQHVPGVEEMVAPVLECLTEKIKTERFSPVQISASVWAVSEFGLKASDVPELMEGILGQVTPEMLNSFANKDLTNFVWGLALLDIRDSELPGHIAALVTERASDMEQKQAEFDLPMLACALTQLQAMNDETWEAMGSRLTKSRKTFRKMRPWGIAALTWSLPSNTGLDGKTKEMAERVEARRKKLRMGQNKVERCLLGPAKWK